MGGTQSKSTSDVLTMMGTNIASEVIQNCSSMASQSQLIEMGEVAGDFRLSDATFKQGVSIDMECVMDSSTQNEIANKMAASLAQEASAHGQGVMSALGGSSAEVQSNIATSIQNNISNNTKQETESAIFQEQAIKVGKVGGDVVIENLTMDQSAEVIAKGLMQSSAYNKAIQDTSMAIDQKSAAKNDNWIAGIVGEFTGVVTWIVVGIVGVLIIAAIIIFIIIKTN